MDVIDYEVEEIHKIVERVICNSKIIVCMKSLVKFNSLNSIQSTKINTQKSQCIFEFLFETSIEDRFCHLYKYKNEMHGFFCRWFSLDPYIQF